MKEDIELLKDAINRLEHRTDYRGKDWHNCVRWLKELLAIKQAEQK